MTARQDGVPATPDAAVVARWCRAGLAALRRARDEIDTINVYPVADGDTGTNLCRTMEAVVDALGADPRDLPDTLRTVAHAALLGARGNSGVILSQMLRGLAESLDGREPVDGPALSGALRCAADLAYAAVGEPVEGTVLTVARAAADAAAEAAGTAPGAEESGREEGRGGGRDLPRGDADVATVARAAADGAREALTRTPRMLDVLADAGVVDAGGRGLVVLLDALVAVVTGAEPTPETSPSVAPAPTGEADAAGDGPGEADPAGGPSFEVMYLLDAEDAAVGVLRARLAALGDSLVVVGGDGLWNVHVHVDDAGAAVEAGIEAGRPHRVRVTALDAAARRRVAVPRRVVGLAAGEGMAALLRAAGALALVAEAGDAPLADDVLAVVHRACAPEVVLLPNDAGARVALEEAAARARAAGVRATVLPTRSPVQGLAALAVHDAQRGFDDDVVAMTSAAGATRYGEVVVADTEAVTSAGVCRPGDVLGLIEGDVAVIGGTVDDTARTVCTRLLSGGGELVTLVRGREATEALTDALVRHLHATRPEVDTVVYDGGQPTPPLLVGVE
jgi:uncharacterized protein